MTVNVVETPRGDGGSTFRSIDAYVLLANYNGSALVNLAESIDWLCVPRYDSLAIFARLLDPNDGHWSIAPVGDYQAERRYLPGTLVLETTFTTPTGWVPMLDAMAFALVGAFTTSG